MSNAAYMRVVYSEEEPEKRLACWLIGAQLEPGAYGSREIAFPMYLIDTDEREQEIREAIAARRPIPRPALETSPGAAWEEPRRLGLIAISGFGWKSFVEEQIARQLAAEGQQSPLPERRGEERS
jgi:hypothetical protein